MSAAVTLYYHDHPKLISRGPLSAEYTAGLVIGLFTLLRREAGANPYYRIRSDEGHIDFHLQDVSGFLASIHPFLVLEQVLPKDILSQSKQVPPHQYGWWIQASYYSGVYNLYTFTTEDFISGFITAFAQTSHDFRDYIAGPPFIDGVPVIIAGYEIKLFNPQPRVPDLLVPYETGTYEIGVPYGIDYE